MDIFFQLRLGGILLAVSLSGCARTNVGPDDALETSRYEIEQITNPNRKGSLLDLQHHFHIDVTNAKVPINVKLPIQLKHLRDADVDSLSLVYHVPKKDEYEMIGQLETADSTGVMVSVIKTGNYSVIGLPADALSRSMIKAYCGQRKIPRICTEIDCRSPPVGDSVAYVPGVPPCELCNRMQQDVQFAECLLDFPDIVFPSRIVSRNGGNGSDEVACEFRAFPGACILASQAPTEQQCLEQAEEISGFRAGDLTGQSCVCGTSEQSIVFDPPPNGCIGEVASCIGRIFNCEAVSE